MSVSLRYSEKKQKKPKFFVTLQNKFNKAGKEITNLDKESEIQPRDENFE